MTVLGLALVATGCSSQSTTTLVVGAVVAAILANGLLATFEDDLPGGWSNPDGTKTPRYVGVVKETGRWSLAILSAACALVLGFVEPIPQPEGSPDLPRIVIAGGCALIAAGLVSRRRALSAVGAVVILGSAMVAAILVRQAGSG